MLIYKLTSPSGKSYIGKTQHQTPDNRIRQHINGSKKGSKIKLSKAIRKYGIESFDISIIEQNIETLDQLNEKEIYYIEKYDSYKKGYNMTKGGDGVDSETQRELKLAFYQTDRGLVERERRSKVFKENNPGKKNIGKPSKHRGKTLNITEDGARRKKEASDKQWAKEGSREEASERTKQMWKDGVFDNRPKPTQEQIQRGVESRRGFKQSDHQKETVKEAQKSTYHIIYSDGREETFRGLGEYSEQIQIPYDTLMYLIGRKKSSKKWGIESIKRLDSTKRIKHK